MVVTLELVNRHLYFADLPQIQETDTYWEKQKKARALQIKYFDRWRFATPDRQLKCRDDLCIIETFMYELSK